MVASIVLTAVSVLLWVGLTVVSGQPAFLLVAAACAAIFGAPFIAWARRRH